MGVTGGQRGAGQSVRFHYLDGAGDGTVVLLFYFFIVFELTVSGWLARFVPVEEVLPPSVISR